MKKMKLLTKILFYCLVCMLILVAVLHFTLIYVAPLESVKNKIVSIIKEQTSADVSIGSISASIFDFQVKDIELKIEEQNIAHIDTIYIHFSLIHLIKGHLRVQRITLQNFNVTIIKDKNGKFNFDPILESPLFKNDEQNGKVIAKEKDEDNSDVLSMLLFKTQLDDSCITYIDEQNDISIVLDKTSFNIDGFKLDDVFKINFYTKVSAKTNGISFDSLFVALTSYINLKSMNLSEAEIKISPLILRLQDTIFLTKGMIYDLQNPDTNFTIKILNLSSDTFSQITKFPEFSISEIQIQSLLNLNLNDSLLNIEKINVNVLDSDISVSGKLDYGKQNLKYDIKIIINLVLDKICQSVKLTKEYKPEGRITANLNVTDKSSVITGSLSLIDVCAFTPQAGDITELNSEIKINDINDIQIPSLTGKLNSYPFESSAHYVIGKDKGNININFFANKIYTKMSKDYEKNMIKKQEETVPETKQIETSQNTESEKSDFPLPPLDVKATFKVNDMNVPYFMGKDINFNMNMKHVTTNLNNIEGILDLNTSNGTIKDIYKLTESNAVMKGLFLSLKVVSDVINALNVLDILNSIGSAIVSSSASDVKEEIAEENAAAEHEQKNQKIDGKIDFISFITSINFAHGKGIFDKCSFVSNLLSFKIKGNMNFKDNLLDMTVNAAPGRHEDDGIMPLTMKIGGTMDEPSGSLSLLGSLSNLVGDALMKNVVSDSLKTGFTKLLGLKKHDEQGNDIQEKNEEQTKSESSQEKSDTTFSSDVSQNGKSIKENSQN